jgi:hypothetical protein
MLNFVNSQNYQANSSITTYTTGISLNQIIADIIIYSNANPSIIKPATLLINKSVNLDNDLIIPEYISLKFYNGSLIDFSTHVLTINGSIEAGAFQIFKGTTGNVNGNPIIEQALPHWWKDINSTNIYWSDAIQKAVDFYPKVFFPKLNPGGTNINLHAYHIETPIILDLHKPHFLYGVGSQSLFSTYYSNLNDYVFKCDNIPANFNLGLVFENLEFRCKYGIALNGGELNGENFTAEDKIILRAKIANCFFKKHDSETTGETAILLKKTFNSEVLNNRIEGFKIGVLLQGSDLNNIHDNKISDFGKYAICDLAYNYFGSQNLISHNDLLYFTGIDSDYGSFIKSNSRHIIIRDNYMENNNFTTHKLFAYVDCSKVGLPQESNYADLMKNIEITGNRCDVISNDCTKYIYYINERFKSLNLVEVPNLNDNYTNGSSFGEDSYDENPVSHILMKIQYSPEWDKIINMVNCESFKDWDNFSTSKNFNHYSNGDIIINSKNISFSSNHGDYPMQRFNGKSILIEPDNSLFVKLNSDELFKNINVKIKIRNLIPDTNSDDLYFALKATTTSQNFTQPLYWLAPIDIPNDPNYSIININIPNPFNGSVTDYPTDRFDVNKDYYLQIHAKNSIKEIKEIIIENANPVINSAKNKTEEMNESTENISEEEVQTISIIINDDKKLYPNPTETTVNFEIDKNSELKSIELYTTSGAFIGDYTKKIDNNSINLSSLPSGSYLLKVTTLVNSSEIIIKK